MELTYTFLLMAAVILIAWICTAIYIRTKESNTESGTL